MNALRLTLCLPGATAADLVAIARWADHWNLAGLWIGDPRGRAPDHQDSYVTAAAAAVAAVTEDLRIGVLLTLPDGQHEVRVAEDVAVVDNASHGRMEIGLVTPPGTPDAWIRRAATFLRSWTDLPVPGGGTVAVTPLPVQPQIPRVVVGDRELAAALGCGLMILDPDATSPLGVELVARRTIATARLDGAAFDWLATDPVGRTRTLRSGATLAGAQELMLIVTGGAATVTEHDIEALGRVVVPALRCVPDEVDGIVDDAWTWLTERTAIHDAPA